MTRPPRAAAAAIKAALVRVAGAAWHFYVRHSPTKKCDKKQQVSTLKTTGQQTHEALESHFKSQARAFIADYGGGQYRACDARVNCEESVCDHTSLHFFFMG